ncbi:MAG: hypothetical protein AABW64_03945 [Nanoarchaeota archaeon]
MQMNKFLTLVFVLLFLSVLGTVFIFQLFEKTHVLKEIPILVRIGNKVGIDVNTTALTFGTLQPGLSVERILQVRTEKTEKLHFFVTNISFIFLDEDTLFISPNETRHIRVTAAPPLSTPIGEYHGLLLILGKPADLEVS